MIDLIGGKKNYIVAGLLVMSFVTAIATVLPVASVSAMSKASAQQQAKPLSNKKFKQVFKAIKASAQAAGTYNSHRFTSRDDLLQTFGLTQFDSIIYTGDFAPLPTDFYQSNKAKVYIHVWYEDGNTFIDIAHWDKKYQLWTGYDMSDLGVQATVWGATPPYVG